MDQKIFWGSPENFGGITVQTSYWKGRWHQIESAAGRRFFLQVAMEIREKRKFFVNRSLLENLNVTHFCLLAKIQTRETMSSSKSHSTSITSKLISVSRLTLTSKTRPSTCAPVLSKYFR